MGTRTEEHCTVSLLTCRNFFVSVSVFSLSLTFLLLLLFVFPGLQQTNRQTNERTKKKKIVKTQLAAWYHEKKCEKRSIVFFLSFFLTKKWKNKNCDDSSLAKKQT